MSLGRPSLLRGQSPDKSWALEQSPSCLAGVRVALTGTTVATPTTAVVRELVAAVYALGVGEAG